MLSLTMAVALAGCATPRDTCLRGVTTDLNAVDRLIAETEANLARGYAIEREPYTTTGLDFCLGYGPGQFNRAAVGLSYCNTTETRYREVPRAIDRTTERRKLAELRQTRARLVEPTRKAVAQCEARYPAG